MINHKLQSHFLLVLLVGTLILSFFIFKPFLAPLALAAVFAVVLEPLYQKVFRRTGMESLSAFFTVVLGVVCILVPISFLGTQVFQEARQLYGYFSFGNRGEQEIVVSAIQNVGHSLQAVFPGAENYFLTLSGNLDVYAQQGLGWIVDHLGVLLSSTSVLFLDLFVFVIALFYLLRDGRALKQSLVALSPLNDADDEMIFDRLKTVVNSVVKGSLLIGLIQGCLTAVGFTLFGVPNGILWGTLATVASLIPGLGTAVVTTPAIIYLLLTGHLFFAVGLLLWGILAVGLVDNLLAPKLMGRGTQLHPLLILLAVLGGLAFFGPIGIFLGPLSLNLLFAFIAIYVSFSNQSAR